MKADPALQLLLLDVQQADTVIAQVAHKTATLPEAVTVRELESEIAELEGARIEAETKASDLAAEQRRADGDVEQVRARRERDTERLNSGAITNPKDLSSLQHEIEALNRRIMTLEDEELEVMEALEEATSELQQITDQIEAKRTALATAVEARDAALGGLASQGGDAQADRDDVAVRVPDDLLALYDKLRGQYGGIGAAPLRARSCEGCRLELNGADLREISDRAADDVVRCPECSRILVRTPESGL